MDKYARLIKMINKEIGTALNNKTTISDLLNEISSNYDMLSEETKKMILECFEDAWCK